MTVKVTLYCDGCDARTEPHTLPHRNFHSFKGSGYGFGFYIGPEIKDINFPSGWLYSDPYTGCTYCPDCWEDIMEEAEKV